MHSDEKLCPFCAEPIKTEAIRCKHCHADLTQKIVLPDSLPSERKLGILPKLLIGVVGLGVAFLGFGFFVNQTPEGKAKADARNAIDQCHREESRYSGPAGAKDIISGACAKMESDFRVRFGHAP